MKTTRIILSLLLAVVLALGLCACGGKNEPAPQAEAQSEPAPAAEPAEKEEPAPEPEKEAEPEPEAAAPALPTEGEYTLFAVLNEGYIVESAGLEMTSVITLDPDGTGYMTMDEDGMGIASWTEENGTVTITLEDESSADAAVKNGVLELDIFGDGEMLLYYAMDGADTSAYDVMTVEELMEAYEADVPDSRLYGLFSSLDTEAGVHMRYEMHSDFMDSDSSYDVHCKAGVYYSQRTTKVSGLENTTVTFFQDGKAYNLDPEEMQGLLVTETSSDLIASNVMVMDGLYSLIWNHAQDSDYTEETREIDGVTYDAEVYPATEYLPEAVFCFDDAGQLAVCIEGAPVVEGAVDIGETVYRLEVIDGEVDESLFDISAYDISEF